MNAVFDDIDSPCFFQPNLGYFSGISGTLPETNSSHLKMDGWNTTFHLGRPIFRGHVSFRECNISHSSQTSILILFEGADEKLSGQTSRREEGRGRGSGRCVVAFKLRAEDVDLLLHGHHQEGGIIR